MSDNVNDFVLKINGLKTHYFTKDGVVVAVDDLSLDVAPGEILGVVGESGCGKSTIALSIMGLLPQQGRIVSGQILINGIDIVPLNEREMRVLRSRTVSMVFQDALAALDPTMQIGKQLMEPLQEHLNMSSAEARERAIDLLGRVGIPSPDSRLKDYPHQFSGGMRQRVMIALALSCDPKLLLADEPVTALDVTVQKQILDLIISLRDQFGTGVVLITHDVGVVAATCDRIAVMYAGRKVESGPTERVFNAPKHPYTIGLLNSSLKVGQSKNEPLQAIPGIPPDLIELPPGCPFWTRCPWQTEICRSTRPSLEPVGEGHFVECWHKEMA